MPATSDRDSPGYDGTNQATSQVQTIWLLCGLLCGVILGILLWRLRGWIRSCFHRAHAPPVVFVQAIPLQPIVPAAIITASVSGNTDPNSAVVRERSAATTSAAA